MCGVWSTRCDICTPPPALPHPSVPHALLDQDDDIAMADLSSIRFHFTAQDYSTTPA